MNRRQILSALVPLSGAGCLRLSSGRDDDSEERRENPMATETLASTETSGRAETDGEADLDYPPGLSADGVDAFLPDAHVNALAGTSFTEVWQSTNVTKSILKMHRTAHIDEGTALVEWRDGSDITKYSTRNGQYWRQPTGDEVTYGKDSGTFDFRWLSRIDKIRRLVEAGKWNAPTVDEATNAFEITADGYDDTAGLERSWWRVGEMESFSATGRVSERGVITRLRVEFQYVPQHEDRLYMVQVRHRVENVGEVSVTEPNWYETARERAPEVTARLTDDRQFVEMHHRGGNPIVPGTAIAISEKGVYDDWGWGHNEEPIEAGTTLYLWIEDGQPQWTRESRPEAADPQTLDDRYEFKMLRDGAHYFRLNVG